MKHLLLKNAFVFKKRIVSDPHGFVYNKSLGVWIHKSGPELLVFHSEYPKIGTKKLDAETGEDHKGQ